MSGHAVPLRLKAQELVQLLGKVDLFGSLSQAELAVVAAAAKEWEFAAGEVIVREGEVDSRLHVILEGSATVQVDGREIDRLIAGAAFGDVAMLDGGPRSATVVAETDVRTIALVRINFRPLLEAHPSIAEKLIIELCRRLRLERAADTT